MPPGGTLSRTGIKTLGLGVPGNIDTASSRDFGATPMIKMGIHRPVDTSWPGPGTAYEDSYGEMTQRAWYAEWLRAMAP